MPGPLGPGCPPQLPSAHHSMEVSAFMASSFKLLSIMGWQWVLEKMLVWCSAQANVVCAVWLGGKEEGPPFLGDVLSSQCWGRTPEPRAC